MSIFAQNALFYLQDKEADKKKRKGMQII
jgi:hypothetical protein